jgi:hypothetical protein
LSDAVPSWTAPHGRAARRCGSEAAQKERFVATHSATASVGQPAPEFSLDDVDGRTVRLADERAHGPVVVVFLRGFA